MTEVLRIQILYVEDDRVDRMAFERFVAGERLPYDCTFAASVFEAASALGSGKFDIAIVDYRLGDGTALDLFGALGGIPCIIVTGSGDQETAVRAIKEGASDYLLKDQDRAYLSLLPKTVENAIQRRRTEKAMKESEEKFRVLAEKSPNMIFINKRGRIVYANEKCSELMGYAREEFLSSDFDFFTLIAPESMELVKNAFSKQMKGEDVPPFEYALVTREGAKIDAIATTKLIDVGGEAAILGIITDITERKSAEYDLQVKNTALATSINGIAFGDLQGKLTYVNRSLLSLWGYDEEREMLGRPAFEFWAKHEEAIQVIQALHDRGSWVGELKAKRKDGSLFDVHLSASLVYDSDKKPICLMASFDDITERKRIELEQRKFVSLIENSSDFIGIAGLDGQLVYLNKAGKVLVGLDCDDDIIKTKSIFAFFFAEDLHKLRTSMLPTGYWQGEFRMRHFKTGLEIPVEFTGFVIRDIKTGEPIAHAAISRDITLRKKAEMEIRVLNEELEQKVRDRTKQLLDAQDELVRKEKLATLGQVAGTVGHELRNPLGVMNNAIYYLQTVLSDANETTKEYLGIIKSEIVGAERIVSDLLDAVRTKPPHPQLFFAEDLIRMSLEKCRVPERITVEILSETRQSVLIDPLQMTQVFINLISNAVDAMPEGGELRVQARLIAECGLRNAEFEVQKSQSEIRNLKSAIEISVSDTGCGISPENMENIFQPLFTTKARGIGLGLAVVKNLTEANGGRMKVESRLGKGTTFTVILPCDLGKKNDGKCD